MNILIIDDDERIRAALTGILEEQHYSVRSMPDGRSGLDEMARQVYHVLLLDVYLPDANGLDLLKKVQQRWPDTVVIMMSGQADIAMAVEATRSGAYHFFEKPFQPDRLLLDLAHLDQQIRMKSKLASVREISPTASFIAESQAMKEIVTLIEKIGPTDSRVMIAGENGTGKEVIARLLYEKSSRKKGPFVSINCAAIPDHLVESELFGHEKGAFTGAVQAKPGKFELAQNGTLFLDEIGDMDLSVQSKLLRVLAENEAVRVGGTRAYSFNVRVITATNKNLPDEVKAGRFREDLYYRLNVIPIFLPPLRSRIEDIRPLAVFFLEEQNIRKGRKGLAWTPEALDCLVSYAWPGNVRELRNFVERISILAEGPQITRKTVRLLLHPQTENPTFSSSEPDLNLPLKERMQVYEKSILERGLHETGGNISRLAKNLQVDRANLHRKLKLHGLS